MSDSTPLELRLKVDRKGKTTFETRITCDDLGIDAGPFALKLPLDETARDDLRWYLERYPRWPVGPDVDRAERIKAQLEGWGRALFAACLGDNAEALRVWTQFRERDPHRPHLATLDCTEPEVLRQPWELLADEDAHLFAAGIGFRRRLHKAHAAPTRTFDLPVRILMVIARPEDDQVAFIDPRASSQALLAALEPLGEAAATVEFLTEGTLAALDRRLADPHAPPVHVVHFDGHGIYDARRGLGYLVFEAATPGAPQGARPADLVDADQLGTLLARSGVPLMVLDACQSAHADTDNPFSSVAPRLIRAGVGSVVAMQYSVLVPTSKRFFAAFYAALVQGATIGQAMDAGRRDLLRNEFRFMLHHPDGSDRPIRLRDWFLPALYQQAADPAPFLNAAPPRRQHTAAESGAAPPSPPLLGPFPVPRYDFVGRARELWRLERLLQARRIVVLHAFGGQGKTALATEAAGWLARKGRFARALFLSFEQGGAADWALAQLGRLLLGNDFASLGEAGRLPALQAALAEAPTLLVWDNFESVLPGANAALPPDALRGLLDLGARLAEGATRLLVTTRDANLLHDAFRAGRETALLPLAGLSKWEALDLAGSILDALGHQRPPRLDLERLLDFLGGHPLSIQLATPHLKDYPDVATVIDRFEALYPGFTEGQAQRRDESLDVSLRFSLDRLSEAARARAAALGVFEGGAFESMILMVTGMRPSEWAPVRAELVRAGLATVELESPFGIQTEEGAFGGHFLRFHPTLAPALRRRLDAETLAALETVYWQAYYALARHLYTNDDRDPIPTRAVAQRALPNLRRGVALALAAGALEQAVDFADSVERFLNVFGRWREREALMAAVERAFGGRSPAGDGRPLAGDGGPLSKAEWLLLSRRGELLLDAGRAREAEEVFRGLLARMGRTATAGGRRLTAGGRRLTAGEAQGEVGGYEGALTLHRLGRSLRGQGRVGEAEAAYREALQVLEALHAGDPALPGDGPGARLVQRATGAAHTDLADVLVDQGRYAEARAHYEAALEIAQETDDERQQGVVLGQLGTLALQQGDLAEAERRYQDALQRFHDLGETRSEAIFWHQLGRTYQTAAERAPQVTSNQQPAPSPQPSAVSGQRSTSRSALLQQAAEAYQQSLQLKEALGDQAGAAQTANQLARVAQLAGRPGDAARWYRREIAWDKESGRLSDLAIDYNNLAGLLLAAARGDYGDPPPEGLGEGGSAPGDLLAEAETLALQAARLMEQVGDPSLALWATYNILAGIADLKNDPAAARAWRRKARAAYVAFPGHWANLSRQWGQVVQAVAAVARDEVGADVRAALESQFERWEQGNWRVTAAFRRIWDGERDVEALTEGIDPNSALIISKTLEAVASPAAANAIPRPPARDNSGAPDNRADQEAQARALMQALEAWLHTPAGQAALGELHAQGLEGEALLMALLQRFMAE